jgi:ferritin-like metal-binding protein YciE
MEAQNDQQIASLKATVDLQKIEMQARFDNFQKQYDQISNLLTALPGTSQVMELDAIKQMVEQNKADTDAQLSQVMTAVSRKKKRIPIRDQMGDIVEVREIDDDDNVLPPGVVSGPPGSPVMN